MTNKKNPTFDLNPFAKADTPEKKEKIWLELQSKAVRVSLEEANELQEKAIRMQKKQA